MCKQQSSCTDAGCDDYENIYIYKYAMYNQIFLKASSQPNGANIIKKEKSDALFKYKRVTK